MASLKARKRNPRQANTSLRPLRSNHSISILEDSASFKRKVKRYGKIAAPEKFICRIKPINMMTIYRKFATKCRQRETNRRWQATVSAQLKTLQKFL
jgi:hypothetical protein